VPPDNFAAWDGTPFAAAHVTGLAALILAHHPDFQPGGPFAERNAARVDRLFKIIRSSARPFQIDDTDHTGYGLPDAVRAMNASVLGGSFNEYDTGQLHVLQRLVGAAQRTSSGTRMPGGVLTEALSRAGLVS
jgi:hypothetical protein